MANVIDRGDAVIYEKYDGQTIDEGQIIVFDYNGMTTVHRVIDIKTVNGVMRYYTKGDANKDADGYVTNKKIYGIVKLKLKYFGYPTLWVRDLFPG
jgi:signal peptidase I